MGIIVMVHGLYKRKKAYVYNVPDSITKGEILQKPLQTTKYREKFSNFQY